ncbi:hypothetical protein BGZ68_003407 [Mortierella alpina]|nr:hypothetical protein BGZ68_003407 [Mortierella alpina]
MDTTPTTSEAWGDAKPEGHSYQEEGGELKFKHDTDSKEPRDVDMNQAGPLETVQEHADRNSPHDTSLNRSPKRMRQDVEETALHTTLTTIRHTSFESEHVWTVQDTLSRDRKPAGLSSALSDVLQGSCARKRKRVDDEVEDTRNNNIESQIEHPSSPKVHLQLNEASDSDTSNATAVVDASMAEQSIARSKGSQPTAACPFPASMMWQAADPTARGAKISAWNDELCKLILSFLECSTVIKIHFELQENARNQVAVPTSRLPVRRDSTMTLTAMSPPALETSLLPSTRVPSSTSHTEAQTRQRRRIARIRATGTTHKDFFMVLDNLPPTYY